MGTYTSLVTTSLNLHKPTHPASQAQLLLIVCKKTNYSTIWFPFEILHDQCRESENILFQRLHKLSTSFAGLRDINTILSSRGKKVERFNRILLSVLRTIRENKKERWKDSLNKVVHAYNCTRNNVTGFSPFYLVFVVTPSSI